MPNISSKPRRVVDGIAPRSHPLQFVPLAGKPPQAAAPQPAPQRTATKPGPARQPEPAAPDEQLKSQPLREPYRLDFTAPDGYQQRRHWWQHLLFPVIIFMCLGASFVVQSLPLGIAAIAVYALVAWIKKIPSRVSFVMAFLAIVTVVALLVIRQNVELAGNFSTYTFLLLIVAVVSTVQESRIKPKQRRSKIPHLRG